MKISIVCVGKIKEKFFKDAIAEYTKRISGYSNIQIIEVADEKTKNDASEKEEEIVKEKEGDRILSKIKEKDYVIALEIKGEKLDSQQLAQKLNSLAISGISDITFVIGGSLGLSKDVLKRADYKLSFSDMTFPHQLMRVILVEQIYRCFKIINKEPYHK